jgi:hypothetical protein
MGERQVKSQVYFFALLSSWLMSATPSFAYGAVANGVPEDVGKDGVAQGYSFGARTPADAEATALKFCRQSKASKAAARCAIARTFNGQCVALALDPEEGTPGYGWGVGDDKEAAQREALVMCYETSGADRTSFCKITSSECDR